MWSWVGRARNGLIFLGLYYCERVCASRVCCLNIVVKLWNSSIFKWLSRLVNKPWMLFRLGLKRNKRACQLWAHTSWVVRVLGSAQGNVNWMLYYCACHLLGAQWPRNVWQPSSWKNEISISFSWHLSSTTSVRNRECAWLISNNRVFLSERKSSAEYRCARCVNVVRTFLLLWWYEWKC